MWKYPDNTYRTTPPAKVEYNDYVHAFFDLSREQWDELGFNEALPVEREPFTVYETRWTKGPDLICREDIVSSEVDEAAKADRKAGDVRSERDRRLSASDWTQLADCPLPAGGKAAWAMHRQALRDVPQQAGFPGSVTWPDAPEE